MATIQGNKPMRSVKTGAMPAHQHIDRIDVLRATAILLVFVYHYLHAITGQTELDWEGVWRDPQSAKSWMLWLLYPFTLGWSGVALFFVISGFCIHHSFLKSQARTGGSLTNFLVGFFQRRFWRIYPPYLLVLMVFYCLALRHDLLDCPSLSLSLHLFMIHNFSAKDFFSINPAFWSLAVEMQFYVLFPMVLFFRKKIGLKNVFWIFVGMSVTCRLVGLWLQDWTREPYPWIWAFTMVLFVDWLMGVLLAEAYFSGKRLLNVTKNQMLAFGLLTFVLTLNKVTSSALAYTMTSIWFAMLMELYLHSGKACNQLEKILIPVGACSYSIYLWHQPLIDRCLHWIYLLGFFQESPVLNLVLMPIVFLGIFIIGYISYRLVELPSIKLGEKFRK
jgi:peptidoglycan/LPS O-acetylase OafA/YrhL